MYAKEIADGEMFVAVLTFRTRRSVVDRLADTSLLNLKES
jgi:hypothetical protein